MMNRAVFLSQRKTVIAAAPVDSQVHYTALALPEWPQETSGFISALKGLDQDYALDSRDQNKIIDAILYSKSEELAECFFNLNNPVLNTYQCLNVMQFIKQHRKAGWLHFYFNERAVRSAPETALDLTSYTELLYDKADEDFSFGAQHFISMVQVAEPSSEEQREAFLEKQAKFLDRLEIFPRHDITYKSILQVAETFNATISTNTQICFLIQDIGAYQIILKSLELIAQEYAPIGDETDMEVQARAVIALAETLEKILTYSQTNHSLLNSININVIRSLIQFYHKNKVVYPSLGFLATLHMVQKHFISFDIFQLVVSRIGSQSHRVREVSIYFLQQMTMNFQVEEIFNTPNVDVKAKIARGILSEMEKLQNAQSLGADCIEIIRALCVDQVFEQVFKHKFTAFYEEVQEAVFQ